MSGPCSRHGKDGKHVENFGGKTKGKKLLGRPRCRWESKTEMNLRDIVWEVVDWMYLARGVL